MSDYAPPSSIQDEVLDFLISSPTPEEIIAFHASDTPQDRLRQLLDANRERELTEMEQAELDEASQYNHLMMQLKARARQALQSQ